MSYIGGYWLGRSQFFDKRRYALLAFKGDNFECSTKIIYSDMGPKVKVNFFSFHKIKE